MQKYFQLKSETGAFHLFSKEHIFTLLVIGLLGVCVIIFRKQLNHGRPNRVFRYVLFIFLAVSQISYHIWSLCHHAWSLKTALPPRPERPFRLFGNADGHDKKQKTVRLPLFCRFGRRRTGDGNT